MVLAGMVTALVALTSAVRVEVPAKASTCRKRQRGARFEEGGKSGYRVKGCRAEVDVKKLQECETCG